MVSLLWYLKSNPITRAQEKDLKSEELLKLEIKAPEGEGIGGF